MSRPDPSYRRLLEVFQRGRWDDVADAADVVAARLLADPPHAPLAPIPVLLLLLLLLLLAAVAACPG